jgi:hypothetical protein
MTIYNEELLGNNFNSNNFYPWIKIEEELPPLGVKVIKSDYAVRNHPEYNYCCIDYLTKHCETGKIIWWNSDSEPDMNNEIWMPIPKLPFKY